MTHDMTHDEVGWAYKVLNDDLPSCGCGYYAQRMELLRQVLRDCPSWDLADRSAYDSPLAEWMLAAIDGAGLIGHGVTIASFWSTEKGRHLLSILEDEAAWKSLVDDDPPTGFCMCGNCPGDSDNVES